MFNYYNIVWPCNLNCHIHQLQDHSCIWVWMWITQIFLDQTSLMESLFGVPTLLLFPTNPNNHFQLYSRLHYLYPLQLVSCHQVILIFHPIWFRTNKKLNVLCFLKQTPYNWQPRIHFTFFLLRIPIGWILMHH